LKELKRGGVHIDSVLEKEDHSHPWEAPEALYPVPEPQDLSGRVLVTKIRRDHYLLVASNVKNGRKVVEGFG
jgi:hypothetical protein